MKYPMAAIVHGLALLPSKMNTPQALVMILAIGGQESRFETRKQLGNGPARSYWQFEQAGGVKGVINHAATAELANKVCSLRGVACTPADVWRAMETDDVLGAAFTRLLLWTDPKPLPQLGNQESAWDLYKRTWRPGKPHPDTWPEMYASAMHELAA